ncbi:AAA family ATPase [Planktotalea sp.]|uniref:AAA family ATPase n=1 Tax=Planktotalea sp. TaxID=2029877 RepID=UPI0032991AE1
MAIIHIIEGPVGAGKTSYANKLGQKLNVMPLVLDAWMVTLFQADRPETDIWPWYAERKARCYQQILTVAMGQQDYGRDAIVELGLIRVDDRLKLYDALADEDRDFRVHVLQTPRDERALRVAQRNAEQGETYAMHVSDEVFNIASDMWEDVGMEEEFGREGRFTFVP